MIEVGENSTLVAEALEDEVGVHSAPDELDGHGLLEPLVRARREIHRAHASVSELAEHRVGSDSRAHLLFDERTGEPLDRGRLEKIGRRVVGSKQRFHLFGERLVLRPQDLKKRRALAGRQIDGLVEELPDAAPALGVHPRPSSRWSQAFAERNSRLTDEGEVSRASAVSSIESPPKKRSSTIWA